MKKLILTTLAATAALGVAACDSTPDDAAADTGDTTIVETQPAPAETTVVTTDSATPSDGSTVSVGPDGASASIDTGGTKITADTSGNATVKTD